jgi:hypothetical protein
MTMNGQLHVPAALTSGTEPQVYPLDIRANGPQNRSGHCAKIYGAILKKVLVTLISHYQKCYYKLYIVSRVPLKTEQSSSDNFYSMLYRGAASSNHDKRNTLYINAEGQFNNNIQLGSLWTYLRMVICLIVRQVRSSLTVTWKYVTNFLVVVVIVAIAVGCFASAENTT